MSALLSLPPLISASISVETSPWFAAMALLLALVDLTLALVAYRAAKRASTAVYWRTDLPMSGRGVSSLPCWWCGQERSVEACRPCRRVGRFGAPERRRRPVLVWRRGRTQRSGVGSREPGVQVRHRDGGRAVRRRLCSQLEGVGVPSRTSASAQVDTRSTRSCRDPRRHLNSGTPSPSSGLGGSAPPAQRAHLAGGVQVARFAQHESLAD